MEQTKLKDLESVNQLKLNAQEQKDTEAFFASQEQARTRLNAIDTTDVERMVFVQPMQNVLREDIVNEPFSREDLQRNAPETMDGYWQVPRVVE